MSKYLYGAAVQGIQGFIFQTNELKDIVGASELVQTICTDMFYKKEPDEKDECLFMGKEIPEENIIINAAGNIKCILDEVSCEKAVKYFPKMVMEAAPGITISQAVVEYDEEKNQNDPDYFKNTVDELEKKLRAQRNKPSKSLTMGLMGIERSRKTGLSAITNEDGDFLDEGTDKKRKRMPKKGESSNKNVRLCIKSFGEKVRAEDIPLNIEDMTWRNDWIAIIHADGNGLGEIVREIGSDRKRFKKFSSDLENATKAAARATFADIKRDFYKAETFMWGSKCIPLRPVVLSGDDMTIICRGDIAFTYAKQFLKHFEEETKNIAEDDKGNKFSLTACAGIAYIKSSYPFYYGYDLAEALCSEAKKDAKDDDMKKIYRQEIAASCLMFHKVQSSFVDSYNDFVAKELTTYKDGKENKKFNFGPYYLNMPESGVETRRWTIDKLEEEIKRLSSKGDSKDVNAIKSSLRKWLTAMHNNEQQAEQLKQRALDIISDKDLKSFYDEITKCIERPKLNKEIGRYEISYVCPVYDILTLLSVSEQQTKDEKGGKK